MSPVDLEALKQLVRLPAVLSVPGDSLLGAAASGSSRSLGSSVGLVGASSMLYLGGMALNDYADREVDAEERPNRPIPSGRVPAQTALRIGQGLLAGGVLLAGVAGGKRAFVTASALAGSIYTYDFVAKETPLAPFAMATCRSLDVMMGATSTAAALPRAAVIGAHTVAITSVSRFEAKGGPASVGRGALASAAAISLAALAVNSNRLARSPLSAIACGASIATYAVPFGRAAKEAIADPQPGKLQKVVGTGVMGMIPLQGALISGAGRPFTGGLVTAIWPLAQRFRRKTT